MLVQQERPRITVVRIDTNAQRRPRDCLGTSEHDGSDTVVMNTSLIAKRACKDRGRGELSKEGCGGRHHINPIEATEFDKPIMGEIER